MTADHTSKLSAQPKVEEIGNRVQEIANRLAGFKPALDSHLEDVDAEIGDSLAMLAGLADYVQIELTMIGEQLAAIGKG